MKIEDVFNNRELSILIWIGVVFAAMMSSKSIRKALLNVVKALLIRTFIIIYFLLALYLAGVISILNQLGFWDFGDLKDTLMWLFSVGLIMVFNVTKARNSNYFKDIIKESIKWTVILEYVVSFYSFSLITEIILIPLLVIIGVTQAASERDIDKKHVTQFLTNLMGIIGLAVISYALYKTVVTYESFFVVDNLLSFLLPIIITILFIPFIYFLALYNAYEMLFLRLDFMTKEKEKVKQVKRYIKIIANINLDKVDKVRANFEKGVFYEDTNFRTYIQSLVRKQ